MADYTWDVVVRITGTRDGWSTTLIDAPRFVLESLPQFGSIYASEESVHAAVHQMYDRLLSDGDEIHITATPR